MGGTGGRSGSALLAAAILLLSSISCEAAESGSGVADDGRRSSIDLLGEIWCLSDGEFEELLEQHLARPDQRMPAVRVFFLDMWTADIPQCGECEGFWTASEGAKPCCVPVSPDVWERSIVELQNVIREGGFFGALWEPCLYRTSKTVYLARLDDVIRTLR